MVGSVAVVGMVWSKERIEDLSKSGGNPPGSEAQTHSLTLTLTTHVFDSKFGRVWRLVVFSKTGIFGEDTESRVGILTLETNCGRSFVLARWFVVSMRKSWFGMDKK